MNFEQYKITEEAIELVNKYKRKLKKAGFDIEGISLNDFFDDIEDAIEAVNSRRHFIPTSDKLFEDKYKGIVIRLAICSFAKMGAEGQLAHSENGISRTYAGASEYPNDILKEIVPIGRFKSL